MRSPLRSAHRAAAVVAASTVEGLAFLEQAREAGLGSLVVLVGREPAELVSSMPVVALDELLASTVPAVTVEGYGYDPDRGELWFVGETAEAFQIELEAQARRLRAGGADARGTGRECDSVVQPPGRARRLTLRTARAIRSPRPSRRLRGSSARS